MEAIAALGSVLGGSEPVLDALRLTPNLRMPVPDPRDLQYLEDHPETLTDFISIFGDAAVPAEMR